MDSPPGLTTLLARLAASGTDFVLVGALAAVAQGAPLTTMDVDVVHRRDPVNVDRLLAFLDSVQALRPTREALLGEGHHLLMTEMGPLDVLGVIEGGRGHGELVGSSVTVQVEGQPVKVASLRTLVELKRGSTSAKGRLALAILEETIRRQGRG